MFEAVEKHLDNAMNMLRAIVPTSYIYVNSTEEGLATRQVMTVYAVKPMISAHNLLVNFYNRNNSHEKISLLDENIPTIPHFISSTSLENIEELMKFIFGNLHNPFYYDDRDNYRESACETLSRSIESLGTLISILRN